MHVAGRYVLQLMHRFHSCYIHCPLCWCSSDVCETVELVIEKLFNNQINKRSSNDSGLVILAASMIHS